MRKQFLSLFCFLFAGSIAVSVSADNDYFPDPNNSGYYFYKMSSANRSETQAIGVNLTNYTGIKCTADQPFMQTGFLGFYRMTHIIQTQENQYLQSIDNNNPAIYLARFNYDIKQVSIQCAVSGVATATLKCLYYNGKSWQDGDSKEIENHLGKSYTFDLSGVKANQVMLQCQIKDMSGAKFIAKYVSITPYNSEWETVGDEHIYHGPHLYGLNQNYSSWTWEKLNDNAFTNREDPTDVAHTAGKFVESDNHIGYREFVIYENRWMSGDRHKTSLFNNGVGRTAGTTGSNRAVIYLPTIASGIDAVKIKGYRNTGGTETTDSASIHVYQYTAAGWTRIDTVKVPQRSTEFTIPITKNPADYTIQSIRLEMPGKSYTSIFNLEVISRRPYQCRDASTYTYKGTTVKEFNVDFSTWTEALTGNADQLHNVLVDKFTRTNEGISTTDKGFKIYLPKSDRGIKAVHIMAKQSQGSTSCCFAVYKNGTDSVDAKWLNNKTDFTDFTIDLNTETATEVMIKTMDRASAHTIVFQSIWYELADVHLYEDRDNSDALGKYDEKVIPNVTLHRTLSHGLNTFCLPFNVTTQDEMNTYFPGCSFYSLSSASQDANGVITLNFTQANDVKVGQSYLVENEGSEISEIEFTNRTIFSNEFAYQAKNNVEFRGVTNRYTFTENAPSCLILGANDLLFRPLANTTMKGFRGYFHINGDISASSAPMRINIVDEPTGLQTPQVSDKIHKYINNGQLIISRDGVRFNAQGQLIR